MLLGVVGAWIVVGFVGPKAVVEGKGTLAVVGFSDLSLRPLHSDAELGVELDLCWPG